MNTRATVYFEPEVLKALKIKAIESHQNFSSILNNMAKQYLSEDYQDLRSFKERENEETATYETFLNQLASDGKI